MGFHSFSLFFNGHFQGESGLASFIEANDDGSSGDNWSYKSCKAPVKSSPLKSQDPTFYRLDELPVTQPTVSEYRREWETMHFILSLLSLSFSVLTAIFQVNLG